jgi:hypothetical protein
MTAGRKRLTEPGTLYSFAAQIYWDFRRLTEGSFRAKRDSKFREPQQVSLLDEEIDLSPSNKRRIWETVKQEMQEGRLSKANSKKRYQHLCSLEKNVHREFRLTQASDEATKLLKIPGESAVMSALLSARTTTEIQNICREGFEECGKPTLPNWPIPFGSILYSCLRQYPAQFLAARTDSRFPRSNTRPTTRLKQLWFLSRALAGAIFGIEVRTAINIVGSKRPDELFEDSRAGKPRRAKRKRRRLQ